jgi:hypothetical protein
MKISFNIIISSILTSAKLPIFRFLHKSLFLEPFHQTRPLAGFYLFRNLQPVLLYLVNQQFIQDINTELHCYRTTLLQFSHGWNNSCISESFKKNIPWITFLNASCVILLRTLDFTFAIICLKRFSFLCKWRKFTTGKLSVPYLLRSSIS